MTLQKYHNKLDTVRRGKVIFPAGYYYLVSEVVERIAALRKYQAVCHCGALVKDHGIRDGHTAVEMEEPCPFAEEVEQWKRIVVTHVEQIATLERDNKVMAALNDGFPLEIIRLERQIAALKKVIAQSVSSNRIATMMPGLYGEPKPPSGRGKGNEPKMCNAVCNGKGDI